MARARRKVRTRAPEDETKREKFLRIGQPRVNRALRTIQLIGNLSAVQYEYNEDDVAALRISFMQAIEEMLARFEHRVKRRSDFHFAGASTTAPSQVQDEKWTAEPAPTRKVRGSV